MIRHLAPLDAATPLRDVLACCVPGTLLGVWIALPALERPAALRVPANPRWISLLISSDLASLTIRTPLVLLQRRGMPWVAPAARLRELRCLEVLEPGGGEIHPLAEVSPEAVVAERRRTPRPALDRVTGTRVIYLEPVDSRSGASLG